MNYINVHQKKLPVPAFFQVYNFGGGNGDKDREIVYAELGKDTPALINYYYICNRYPHLFQSKLFDDVQSYSKVGDLYNHIRNTLIQNGEIYSGYSSVPYDFNDKVFLLDSGAFNIVKQVAKQVDYDVQKFMQEIVKHALDYYKFAHALNFDMVVSFDMGGKYTEKDGEKTDKKLNDFFSQIDTAKINNMLLEEAAKFISSTPNYYPYILATVHGATQQEYRNTVNYILSLEKKYSIRFWGFALGGIASYKQVDESWYNDVDLTKTKKRGFIETITPARACRIVRALAGDRPIHALGCGGYNNIALNYYCGATSFDSASPVRRVGDGNLESTKIVFDSTPSKEGFSKFFIGGINMNGTMRGTECGYIKLNQVADSMPLCGCIACNKAINVHNIKTLYAMKASDDEANYYSRQLIGYHAIWQHRMLCETVSKYPTMSDLSKAYPNKLNIGLDIIYNQL